MVCVKLEYLWGSAFHDVPHFLDDLDLLLFDCDWKETFKDGRWDKVAVFVEERPEILESGR
jgi:hypothetical protein